MNVHIAKIKETLVFLKEVVPICYLMAIKNLLDEILTEVEAVEKELDGRQSN
jgi:hypothetical protein